MITRKDRFILSLIGIVFGEFIIIYDLRVGMIIVIVSSYWAGFFLSQFASHKK